MMRKYFAKKKARRFRFNIAMNPFVLVSIVAATAMVTWLTMFYWFRF